MADPEGRRLQAGVHRRRHRHLDGCASLTFRGLGHLALGLGPAPGSRVTIWIVLVAACAIVQLAVNQYLIFAALRATDPAIRARDFIFGPQTLRNDLTEMCMAVLSTLAIAMSLLTVVIALPLATLLQRSALHAQLIKDARTDSKTGLLNAATWERDATAEVTRAVRTRTALAVAMLDIDRFKAINDTYGHLLGDQVIKEIAHTLTALLRNYDRPAGSAATNSPCCCRRPGRWMPSGSPNGSGPPSPACASSHLARTPVSGSTSRCRSGWPRWTAAASASMPN